MIGIRDISIKHRLLVGNFIMVFIPVCILLILALIMWGGLRYIGLSKQEEMHFLLPRGNAVQSVQFAMDSLREDLAKRGDLDWEHIQEDIKILESEGIAIAVLEKGQKKYSSSFATEEDINELIQEGVEEGGSTLKWDKEEIFFVYPSTNNEVVVIGEGNVPLVHGKGKPPKPEGHEFFERAIKGSLFILLIVGIIIISILGTYLSRLLSRQIIEPLSELRLAATRIREGKLDEPLVVSSQDELGDTCRAFERMRMELKEAKDLQEKYEQNRKELIAGISHDLATPLTMVKGYASGVIDGIAKTEEKRSHYMEMIYKTACNMEKLVDTLFLFSKLELGRVPFHPESLSIKEYLVDFLEEKHVAYKERGLNISLITKGADKHVYLDRVHFQRIIDNILENAIKYNRSSMSPFEIVINNQNNREITVSFIDHGPGVDFAEREKLFDIFYRTDKARSNVEKGSGLGLAVVKQMVETMNGTIKAQETPGGGLTIICSFPVIERK